MKKTFSSVSSLAAIVFSAAAALAQAGAPTQRVHIPGIPDGTSIYPNSTERGNKFVSIGCVTKSSDAEFRIIDWRGAEQASVANAPPIAAREPLVLRLEGDREMLNFDVGHEVQISGPILETATASPAKIKVESILYISRVCWKRGTTTAESATPKP